MTPFAQAVVIDILKIALQGLVLLTALAIAAQLYFRRAIKHEAKKAVVRQRVAETVTKTRRNGQERLLERFERDADSLRRELAETRKELKSTQKSLIDAVKSEAELSRENRYLRSEVEELRKVQPQFLDMMGKFVTSLKAKALEAQPIKGSGGLSRIEEPDDDANRS